MNFYLFHFHTVFRTTKNNLTEKTRDKNTQIIVFKRQTVHGLGQKVHKELVEDLLQMSNLFVQKYLGKKQISFDSIIEILFRPVLK